MRVLLSIGGLLNLLVAVFHAFFPQISADSQSTMYIVDYVVMYVLVVFAFVSVFHWRSLVSTGLGRTIALSIFGFWLWCVPIAEEMVFAGLNGPGSWARIGLCLIIGALYLVPAVLGSVADKQSAARRAGTL